MIVKSLALALSAAAVAATAYAPDPRHELVVQSHDYYQKQFDNLMLNDKDMFGTSRVEWSKIKNHARQGGEPMFGSEIWHNWIVFYGNHGKPLDSNAEIRYRRSPNGTHAGQRIPDVKPTVEESQAFAERTIAALNKGKKGPFLFRKGDFVIEALPFRLSSDKCLSCHTGMKVGDPVALGMYYTVPYEKAK